MFHYLFEESREYDDRNWGPFHPMLDLTARCMLIGLVLLLASAFILPMAAWSSLHAKGQHAWTPQQGQVTRGYIYDNKAYVMYTYKVDGRHHTGESRVTRNIDGSPIGFPDRAKLQARFVKGNAVTVLVNPHAPTQSTLEPGMTLTHYLWLSVGVLLAVVSMVLIAIGLRAVMFYSAVPAAVQARMEAAERHTRRQRDRVDRPRAVVY